ncbi:MAG TPA: TlpA disulfide reductase family protein [Verrucomicrobiae bacterium]|nr:TlpA disulfide reductase family protein [Verrucomicrobiae bacterium]
MVLRIATALLASAFLAACGTSSKGAASNAGGAQTDHTMAREGQPAPAWAEPTASGAELSLASLRGDAVYLNFFATWCPPCNEEAPAIEKLQRRYFKDGLRVVGVDELENAARARQFVKDHGLTYPAVVDSGDLRDQYNVNGLPVHVFIDRTGVVQKIVVGEMQPDEIRTNLLAILH